MDPPLPPEFRPTRDEIPRRNPRRVFATIAAGCRQAAVTCGRAARGLGWARWPRAARADGRGSGTGGGGRRL